MQITRRMAVTAVITLAVAGTARAHVFPNTAKSLKSSLVQNYAKCSAPDTTTSDGTPACGGEPDPIDTVCTFGNTRSNGSLEASIQRTGIKLKATLRSLAPSCEGETLSVVLGVRTTTDDCAGGHCVVTDRELSGGTCTVSGGRCIVSTIVPSPYPAGAGSEMTVLTCGVRHGALDAFACGIMVP